MAAWALEQLAQHSEDTAGPLLTAGALTALVQAYCCSTQPPISISTDELQAKRKAGIKTLIRCAPSAQLLEPFVDASLPVGLLKHVLRRVRFFLAAGLQGWAEEGRGGKGLGEAEWWKEARKDGNGMGDNAPKHICINGNMRASRYFRV